MAFAPEGAARGRACRRADEDIFIGSAVLGRIFKQGDSYLRWLLVAGAMSVIRQAKRRGTSNLPWLDRLIANKPTKVAAVALANKMARIAWALLMQGGTYRKPATGAA